jgi:hypothetical protein
MLKRLLIFNSDIYSKADIELDNCNSLQIVGPNNIGKSTLIYALNFLYIIDGNQMTFSGNRVGDKTTINHYFPSINSSYIVFEVFKNRYYSILVKKNAESSLEYYKIDSNYKEELYFKETRDGKQLRKFNDLLTELSVKGIEHSKFTNRRDVFNFVYQKGKRNNSVVWLSQDATQDARGISNNFSKIYKFLINSKLINNETLKDSLIIADNKANEKVTFSKKNQKDILTLLKHNKGIKVIKSIQKNFNDFKELVNQYKGKGQILSELLFAFNHQYSYTNIQLGEKYLKDKKEKDANTLNLNENLTPKKDKLNKLVGGLEIRISQKTDEIENKEKLVLEIVGYEKEFPLLEQSLLNLDKDRKDIESQITQIETQNISSNEVERKIKKLRQRKDQKNTQIEGYSNQLIHQITNNQENKEIINRILSTEITSLPKDSIINEIGKIDNIMNLFDGKIKLPDTLKGKAIESIEDLKNEVKQLDTELKVNEKLLPIVKNLEKYQKQLTEINEKIKVINIKIEKINKLPILKTELEKIKVENTKLKEEKEKSEKEVKLTEEQIRRISESINILTESVIKTDNRIKEIQKWKIETELFGIQPIEYDSKDSLDNLYLNIQRNHKEREDIRTRKYGTFERLKTKTETSYANENDFIKYIDSEIIALEDKQKSIDGLLKNISTQFANPCKTIYSKFEEFDDFIKNKFNSKLRKTRISDIDSLRIEIVPNEKLLSDLKKIMEIRDLTSELIFDNQSENLNTLNKYLDDQKSIVFKDLFSIKLHLDKKGKHKVVDLKNQIESDGTDKMIRLVIIMSIINQIVISDSENKIVLFVDEIGTIDEANRLEILKFCSEHNFIPISAAPLHPYDGFDKYYLIRRSSGKIVVSEKNGNVILRKVKTA